MTQPSGWYDDPQDPSQLRYWDGVAWSGNTSPKVAPQVAQSTIGMPYGVTPASARPQGTQDSPATRGGYASPQQNQQDLGSQGGQWPAYGQGPGQHGQGWTSNVATTPDGVALSGWWRRVVARIIDSFVVGILALPLTFSPLLVVARFFVDAFNKAMAAAEANAAPPVIVVSDAIDGAFLQITLTLLVISMVYEIAFLTRKGATPGKMAAGISVRLRERPGPPPMVPVLKRTAVKEGVGILGSLPVVGFFAWLFSLLDDLWPLWDSKKQALHDKVGATNVVMGPQPKRNA